ncbi:MAG: septum formation initiator family protein [Rhodospirillales bacterium]|nr:septum formation initiator family protein [Rhodospirillales bacterium]
MTTLAPRFDWKEYRFLFLGILLCLYFSYHLFHGPRSFFHLQDLQRQNELLSTQAAQMQQEEAALENKVSKLRPETLDPDFLDERARAMLGYMEDDEMMVVE